MNTPDDHSVPAVVRAHRERLALSQADLAERARLATKTVQRLEAGKPIAASSRRAVFEVLGIDPMDFPTAEAPGDSDATATPWTEVGSGKLLHDSAASARAVDIEVDRDEWRQARLDRPWYKQDIAVSLGDPVAAILKLLDEAVEEGVPSPSPGQAAARCDKLGKLLRATRALHWELATRMSADGTLSIYIGSPREVASRVGESASGDAPAVQSGRLSEA